MAWNNHNILVHWLTRKAQPLISRVSRFCLYYPFIKFSSSFPSALPSSNFFLLVYRLINHWDTHLVRSTRGLFLHYGEKYCLNIYWMTFNSFYPYTMCLDFCCYPILILYSYSLFPPALLPCNLFSLFSSFFLFSLFISPPSHFPLPLSLSTSIFILSFS